MFSCCAVCISCPENNIFQLPQIWIQIPVSPISFFLLHVFSTCHLSLNGWKLPSAVRWFIPAGRFDTLLGSIPDVYSDKKGECISYMYIWGSSPSIYTMLQCNSYTILQEFIDTERVYKSLKQIEGLKSIRSFNIVAVVHITPNASQWHCI